jgi:hypothetical protein
MGVDRQGPVALYLLFVVLSFRTAYSSVMTSVLNYTLSPQSLVVHPLPLGFAARVASPSHSFSVLQAAPALGVLHSSLAPSFLKVHCKPLWGGHGVGS